MGARQSKQHHATSSNPTSFVRQADQTEIADQEKLANDNIGANSAENDDKHQQSNCHTLTDAELDVKGQHDIELKLFRQEQSVHGSNRTHLAMTLRGTVRQRREKVREGLSTEPMLRDIVQLPSGQLLNDWIAVNTIHFYNVVSIVYGSLSEFCTESSCPVMSAGNKFQYLWSLPGSSDSEAKEVSAPLYTNLLFDWVESVLCDESVFPRDNDQYPSDFVNQVSVIFRRLFRVYAHIYYSHFDQIRTSGAELHLNSSFQHFAFFAFEFGLLHSGDITPLRRLLRKLLPGFTE